MTNRLTTLDVDYIGCHDGNVHYIVYNGRKFCASDLEFLAAQGRCSFVDVESLEEVEVDFNDLYNALSPTSVSVHG